MAEHMTAGELRQARATLGQSWGLGRPLMAAELGRACRLGGADPGQSIIDYEKGVTKIGGPLSALIALYLAGMIPPDGLGVLRKAAS